MAGGRPPEYSPAVLDKAKDYLVNFKALGDTVPQIAGLAITLDVSRDTIYEWEGDPEKAEFSDIVKLVRTNQERTLINGGKGGRGGGRGGGIPCRTRRHARNSQEHEMTKTYVTGRNRAKNPEMVLVKTISVRTTEKQSQAYRKGKKVLAPKIRALLDKA